MPTEKSPDPLVARSVRIEPSQRTVAIECASKPSPLTVTLVPTGPLSGERAIAGLASATDGTRHRPAARRTDAAASRARPFTLTPSLGR